MKFIVHDYETTGLTKHPSLPLESQPRAIEFAAILTDGEEVLETKEIIINPMIDIEPVITKITGLTNEVLRNEKPFSNCYREISEFFAKGDCAISHNLAFDKAISQYEMQRLGLTLADLNWPKYEACTVEQTFHMFGRRTKLKELYEMAFGKYEQKHRALDDVLLLHKVCKEYRIYEYLEFSNGVS